MVILGMYGLQTFWEKRLNHHKRLLPRIVSLKLFVKFLSMMLMVKLLLGHLISVEDIIHHKVDHNAIKIKVRHATGELFCSFFQPNLNNKSPFLVISEVNNLSKSRFLL